ncbi:Uncharacterised protein r2_g606 [Pycnogonum litorale]
MDQRKALLRRKLERVAKLEAEKNAQRNAMSFAFGSRMSNSQSTVNLVLPVNVNTTPTSRRSNRNFNGTYRTFSQRVTLTNSLSVSSMNRLSVSSTNSLPALPTNSLSVSPCRQQPDVLTGDDGSQDNARNICAVCYDKPMDSILYSCGHVCMCYNCAMQQWHGEEAGRCPICRSIILDVIRIYEC